MESNSESLQDYFSIVMVGDENVGKTSILSKYCNNKFPLTKKKHKSLDIYKKSLEYNGNVEDLYDYGKESHGWQQCFPLKASHKEKL